jgi:hypothetical protein
MTTNPDSLAKSFLLVIPDLIRYPESRHTGPRAGIQNIMTIYL